MTSAVFATGSRLKTTGKRAGTAGVLVGGLLFFWAAQAGATTINVSATCTLQEAVTSVERAVSNPIAAASPRAGLHVRQRRPGDQLHRRRSERHHRGQRRDRHSRDDDHRGGRHVRDHAGHHPHRRLPGGGLAAAQPDADAADADAPEVDASRPARRPASSSTACPGRRTWRWIGSAWPTTRATASCCRARRPTSRWTRRSSIPPSRATRSPASSRATAGSSSPAAPSRTTWAAGSARRSPTRRCGWRS